MYKYTVNYVIITLFLVFLCTLLSCATVKPFPSQDIVISATGEYGRMFVVIKKGNLDKEHKGEWWVTREEFIKLKGQIPKPLNEEI